MSQYAGANWIKQSLKKEMSPLGVNVADLLGDVFAGIYHLDQSALELDAIEPNELVRICRDAVKANIKDQAAWDSIVLKDKRERTYLKDKVDELESCYEDEAENYQGEAG